MFPRNRRLCSTAAPSWCPLCLFVSSSTRCLPKESFLKKSPFVSHLLWLVFTGLYWRIHMIEMMPALVWFILVTLGSTYLIAFAYKNTKFILKHKVKALLLSLRVYNVLRVVCFIRLQYVFNFLDRYQKRRSCDQRDYQKICR